MIYPTVLLLLCILPHMRSVKIVIDGTIDFGPNWNLKYKLNPISGIEPRKRISHNPDISLSSDLFDTKGSEETSETVTTEIIGDSNENDNRVRAESEAKDDSSDNDVDEEKEFGVTRLYKHKTDSKTMTMLRKPRNIRDDAKVINFIQRINSESLKMFDDLRKKLNDNTIVQKVSQLKDRYKNEFGEFINGTMHHTIKTTFGYKKVILNSINNSNKVLNRLANRFKIDLEESGLNSNIRLTEKFREHIHNLKISAHEDACRLFSICRAGNELSDHLSDMITNLLERDDDKVQSTIKAVVKSLKNKEFNKIMDTETQKAFKDSLGSLEELSPFELRVVLMAYKIIIENRHKPFENNNSDGHLVDIVVAMYSVLEGFNKKIVLETEDWKRIKEDFKRWLADGEGDVTDIVKELVDRIMEKIGALDVKTANDFNSKLRICFLNRKLSY